MGVMAEQPVITTLRVIFYSLVMLLVALCEQGSASGFGKRFNIVEDLVDGPDVHGRLFLAPGQRRLEQCLDLTQEFDGIDAVKPVHVPQIFVKPGVFDFELFAENPDNFRLYLSSHLIQEDRKNSYKILLSRQEQ